MLKSTNLINYNRINIMTQAIDQDTLILNKFHQLTPEKQKQILDFMDFLLINTRKDLFKQSQGKLSDFLLLPELEDNEQLFDRNQETIYLHSVPGLVESIKQAEQENDWVSEEEFWKSLDEVKN